MKNALILALLLLSPALAAQRPGVTQVSFDPARHCDRVKANVTVYQYGEVVYQNFLSKPATLHLPAGTLNVEVGCVKAGRYLRWSHAVYPGEHPAWLRLRAP